MSSQSTTSSVATDQRGAVQGGLSVPVFGSNIGYGTGNTVNFVSTDQGAFERAASALRDGVAWLTDAAQKAAGYSATSSAAASDAAARAAGWSVDAQRATADRAITGAIDLAKTSQDASYRDLNAALGFGREAFKLVQESSARAMDASGDANKVIAGAYQATQDSLTGNRSLMMVALAVVGAVGLVAAFRR